MSSYPLTTKVSLLTTLEIVIHYFLAQSHKFHLGQIGDYPLFVQVGIGDPILSNSNLGDIFLLFSH